MEIQLRLGAVEYNGCAVVGAGGVLRSGEGPEPPARPLPWLADLRDPFAPAPLAHPSVAELGVVGASLAFIVAFLGAISAAAAGAVSAAWGG